MRILVSLLVLLALQGCTSMVAGTVTTLAAGTAKVPFKVAGAVVDVVMDDEDEEE